VSANQLNFSGHGDAHTTRLPIPTFGLQFDTGVARPETTAKVG
jgi:hypothetical protein